MCHESRNDDDKKQKFPSFKAWESCTTSQILFKYLVQWYDDSKIYFSSLSCSLRHLLNSKNALNSSLDTPDRIAS